MKSKLLLPGLLAGALLIGPAWVASARLSDTSPSAPLDPSNAPVDNSNPYGVIVDRNVFRLLPIPPPPAAPVADPMAGTTIKLTGFTRETGQPPRALFVSVPKDPKAIAYYNLAEGERDGVLELIKIHEDTEAVEVIHAGNRITVMLKDSKPAGAPGPGPGGLPAPAPIMVATAKPAPVAMPAPTAVPERSRYSGAGAMTAGAADLNTARPIRTGDVPQGPSLDEVHVMMAADAMVHADEIAAGKYPPPLPHIKAMLDEGNSNEGQGGAMPGMPGLPQ